MAETIVRGDDLMLFDEQGKSFAYATAHSLALNGDVMETSSKDSGKWKANQITKLSWEITSENLYTETAYDTLVEKMFARTPIKVFFALKQASELNADGLGAELTNWSKEPNKGYEGEVIISSINANAGTGENATYTVTLTGTGALKKYTGA